MKDGKYSKRRRGVSSKALALTLAVMLVIGCAVGGTLAWLTDKTDEVKNTFATSDVDIDLTESEAVKNEETGSYEKGFQIVPGCDITKDPKVTVNPGSEKCYVFVKVAEANWPAAKEDDGTTLKVKYEIADGWTELTAAAPDDGSYKVYYREQSAIAENGNKVTYSVLTNDVVTVSGSLTKTEMKNITTNPTLTFTAYACQFAKSNTENFTPIDAWNNVKDMG